MPRAPQLPLDSVAQRNLRRHYLFAALSDAQWQRMQAEVGALQLAAGHRLFAQDEPAEAFFVVSSGSIKLYRESAAGVEKIMRLVKSGQSFAESVLFSDPPRYPVHAQCISASLLAVVPCEPYLALLRESFDTCRAVMAQMVDRIHRHWNEIEALSLHSSQGRVARYILDLAPTVHGAPAAGTPAVVRFPAHKALVAGQLGLAPETLSRGLRALADRGIIVVRRQTVEILDPVALGECASR
jgi:CRP/FNR family transcriptional regulator, dissimilatory nitrate respiration regulator